MALPIPDQINPKTGEVLHKPKPRGRPRKHAPGTPRGPSQGEVGNQHTAAVVVTARRQEPGKAMPPEIADAIAVLAGQPELRYLEKAERLAWLCRKVDEEHVEYKACGPEIVPVPTEAPSFKAMEMLQRTLGDYHHATEGTKVLNVVNGVAQPTGQVQRVIRLYLPPSTG